MRVINSRPVIICDLWKFGLLDWGITLNSEIGFCGFETKLSFLGKRGLVSKNCKKKKVLTLLLKIKNTVFLRVWETEIKVD